MNTNLKIYILRFEYYKNFIVFSFITNTTFYYCTSRLLLLNTNKIYNFGLNT